jgi:hypothetical protein
MQSSPVPIRDGYFIIHTDFIGGPGVHWMAVVNQGHSVYVYDSFGRRATSILPTFVQKMVDHGFKIYNTDLGDADQHGGTRVDCGHRSIA